MSYFDPSLGKPLPEVDYGSNCVFYDAENIDPFHNLKVGCFCLLTIAYFDLL